MKKPLCIALSVLLGVGLCLGAFSLSAFAAVNPAYAVKVCDTTSPLISDTSPALININGYLSCFFTTDPDVPLVMCPWNSGSPNNNVGTASCVAMSTDPDAVLYSIRYRTDGTIYSSAVVRPLNLTYVSGGVTYYYFELTGNSGEYCYPIDSMPTNAAGALSACVSALNYSPTPDPSPSPSLNDGGINLSGMSSTNYSFVVPAGYMAVIEYQSDLVLHLQQSFDSYSAVISLNSSAFPNSTAFYLNSNTLPSSGDSFQFPSNSVTQVPYDKTGELTAVLRQSKTGTVTIRQSYISDFIYLCNPSITLYSDHGSMELNHDIICVVNHCDSIRLYPVSTTVFSNSNVTYITSTISGYPYYYTVSGLLRDPTETHNIATVDVPGSNDDEQTVYSRLLSNLTQFFSKGWNSVRSVLDAIGEFPQFFVSLLGALPSDITSIIAGFVGILCCIGVIKALI